MADDLAARLRAHATWLATQGADGARLDLADAPPTVRDLRGASLRDADLTEADLTDVDLRDADLRGADLYGAVLAGADLRGADLTGARLSKADLSHVRAGGARLRRASLVRTDLAGADLTQADLSRTHLVRTDLGGADLTGADLTEADLHLVVVDGSRWDDVVARDAVGTVVALDGEVRSGPDGRRPVAELVAALAAVGSRLTVADHTTTSAPPSAWRWRDA